MLIILLKGRFYKKLENFINKKFPSISKQPSWIKKLIILIAFILIYIIIKQIIFFSLKIVGIDIRQIISESINSSIRN